MLYQKQRTDLLVLLNTAKAKSYPRMLKARNDLMLAVNDYCSSWEIDNTNEKIWLFVNSNQPKYCEFGNKLPFKTYDTGYRLTCSLMCKCKGKRHSLILTQFYVDNPEVKTQIQASKQATCLETYGVKNHMMDETAKLEVQKKMIERYGVKSNIERSTVIKKIVDKNLVGLGVNYPFQSATIRDKAKEAFLLNNGTENTMQFARAKLKEITGVDSIFQTVAGQAIAKKGMVTKFGVEHPLQSTEVVNKMIARNNEKYSRNNPAQCHITDEQYGILLDREKFIQASNGKTLRSIAESLGIDQKTVGRYAVKYSIWDDLKTRSRSQYEDEIENWLIFHNIQYRKNDRTIFGPKEIDFILPDNNLAIEFNGIYYHSELSGGKTKHYHENKMIACRNADLQLITIFENEWNKSKEIIKNKILYLSGKVSKQSIGAREASVKRILFAESRDFLNSNHIQGESRISNIIYGAFIDNAMVGVICFGTSKTGFWDITRFATSRAVSGLFSKMLYVFVKEHNPWCIDTIADLRYSYGDLYEQTGFVHIDNIEPDYFYTTDHVNVYRKEQFRKCKIKKKFKLMEELTEFTEWPKMQELGYDRIWDCGKIKYRWYNDTN